MNAETPRLERPAAVYRLWAEDGTLLYIGSAYNPEERAKAHRHKEWGHLVARQADDWHATREHAYDAEIRAIVREKPAHNLVGTPRHTGPAVRGQAQREAADARWRVAIAALRDGASEEDARQAGGWAEVEYLEASGVMPTHAAKLRALMSTGGTPDSKNMSLPGYYNGKLTWEMGLGEFRQAYAAGVRGDMYPPPQRMHLLGE
ncbi:GIY-YIG nuclease family protein [Streptomyces cinereoruber]|uniref:GIY-YIG nuclease family protein n=1 Tax=Streptomyces cinereoruber TaxID=67260 RepID=UPI00362BCB5F